MRTLLRIFGQLSRYPASAAAVLVLASLGTMLVLVVPGTSQRIIDQAVIAKQTELIWPLAGVAAIAIIVRQGLFTVRTIVNNRFELQLAHDRRLQVYQKLQRLPVGWFDTKSTGDVLSRVSADVPSMQRVILEGLDQGIMAILQIVLVTGFLFWMHPSMTLLMVIPIPFIFGIVAVYTKQADPRATEAATAAGSLQSVLGDSIGGVRQIKIFGMESHRLQMFATASTRVRQAGMSLVRLNAIVWPGVSLITEAWMVITIAVAAKWIIEGQMTLGELTAALLLWGVLYEPVGRLPPILGTTASGVAAARRVFDILDRDEEADLDVGRPADSIAGEIALQDVTFGYQEDRPVLRGLNIHIPAGQTFALVGPTGGGKTTLLHLLTRFSDVDDGTLLVDGVDIRLYAKRSLRQQLGYVTQDAFLFDTTVAENLRLANPDADDEELWDALESAEAAEFVRRMPKQLETPVGERGGQLSGGQRQRLSIARVLLKDPKVLLLDEATSAVDNRTEASIQRAIQNLSRDRTTIVIAHRLSTIQQADQIAFLDQGRIVELGHHDELMRLDGRYADLVNRKF